MAWLAWQLSVVRERQGLLSLLRKSDGAFVADIEGAPGDTFNGTGGQAEKHVRAVLANAMPTRVSFVRRLLGDYGISLMVLPPSLEADWARFAQAFPEAQLRTASEYSNLLHLSDPTHLSPNQQH
jgi:hypothetical protein